MRWIQRWLASAAVGIVGEMERCAERTKVDLSQPLRVEDSYGDELCICMDVSGVIVVTCMGETRMLFDNDAIGRAAITSIRDYLTAWLEAHS